MISPGAAPAVAPKALFPATPTSRATPTSENDQGMSICDSPPVPVIGLFRYNSMLTFIQVSFCFLLFLRLGLRLGFGSVIGLGLGFSV